MAMTDLEIKQMVIIIKYRFRAYDFTVDVLFATKILKWHIVNK